MDSRDNYALIHIQTIRLQYKCESFTQKTTYLKSCTAYRVFRSKILQVAL